MQKGLFSIQLIGAGLALLFANACIIVSDDVAEDEVGDGDGDPGETGDGDGDQTEQGGDGDGDGDGDPGDGDGEPGDGDGDPDPDPAIEEACEAACAVFESCEDTFPGCTEACIEQHLQYADDAECLALELTLTQCMAGLSCDELAQFLEEDPEPYPCQAEYEAICEEPAGECSVGVGMGEKPGECGVIVSCEGEPERSLECDGETCTCYVDDVEVGGCSDALGVCGEPGPAALEACCG